MVEDSKNAVEEKAPESPSEQPSRKETWVRLLYVLLFVILYGVAEAVLGVIVIVQFGFKLITHETNDNLLNFSTGLNKYIYKILQFMTFNSNEKPFPFSDWPGSSHKVE
jgi:hypothetical protein